MAIGNPAADLINMDRSGDEDLLITQLTRVRENPSGHFAVHIHLSNLRKANKQNNFMGLAKRAVEDFIAGNEVSFFTMYNFDMILLCRNVSIDDIDPVIEKVRNVFAEDPLTQTEIGSFDDKFTSWHDLSSLDDFNDFDTLIKDQAAASVAQREKDKSDYVERQRAANLGEPLSPDNLAIINKKIKTTQIADLIRNQSVYKVIPGQKGDIIFREHFIAMAELKLKVAPDVNLFASPWLFNYLTETLDKRVLAVMSRRDFAVKGEHISLNLNVSSIMSREFQQFHDSIEENTDKVVVELQLVDIFSDMSAFNYARSMLYERGYRVLIDGISPMVLEYFDPTQLHADFYKVTWGAEFDEEDGQVSTELKQIVKAAGKERIILSRVDSQDAVMWGANLGITRFQGYFIDKLVATMRAQGKKR